LNDEPELSPEDEARIQRLLADAAATPEETMPPDVAARLDETLAGLVAERDHPTVVPMRRRWPRGLTAVAAAVIVLGVGGVALGNLGGSSDDAASSEAGGGVAADSGDAKSLQEQAPSEAPSDALAPSLARPIRTTAATFAADAARIVGSPATLTGSAANRRQALGDRAAPDAALATCPGPPRSAGTLRLPARYDGKPAVLLVHPVEDGKRQVDAWSCVGTELDSAIVPVPDPAGTHPTSEGPSTSPSD
jgi:hypothetical protein